VKHDFSKWVLQTNCEFLPHRGVHELSLEYGVPVCRSAHFALIFLSLGKLCRLISFPRLLVQPPAQQMAGITELYVLK
jgi:hypothetical protein